MGTGTEKHGNDQMMKLWLELPIGNLLLHTLRMMTLIQIIAPYSQVMISWLFLSIVTPSNSMEKLIPLAQVEQLIDEKIEMCEKQAWDSDRHFWWMVALAQLKSQLSSLPTEESGWIAVKDSLPEIWEVVIICSWGSEILIAHYAGMNKNDILPDFFDINMTLYYTTHWMPLPKPPLQ